MFKVMIFARRKAELDRKTFISIYESQHLELSDRLVEDGTLPPMVDYRRNYLVKDHSANIGPAPDFDVVTEAWFADEAAFAANQAGVAKPGVAEMVGQDLATFLDLESLVYVVVEEHHSTPGMRERS